MADGNARRPLPALSPEEELEAETFNALINGDLEPLAKWIRAGRRLEGELADAVADMIEGVACDYRLEIRAMRRGYRGFAAGLENHQRKMEIGVFIEAAVRRSPRGSYEAIVQEARETFGIGKTAATKAHRYVRDMIADSVTAEGFDVLAAWEMIYSGP